MYRLILTAMYGLFACQQMQGNKLNDAWLVDGVKRKSENKLEHCRQLGCHWYRINSVRRHTRWKCLPRISVLGAKARTHAAVTRAGRWHVTLVADSSLLVCCHGAVPNVVKLVNQQFIHPLSTTRNLFLQLYTTTSKTTTVYDWQTTRKTTRFSQF